MAIFHFSPRAPFDIWKAVSPFHLAHMNPLEVYPFYLILAVSYAVASLPASPFVSFFIELASFKVTWAFLLFFIEERTLSLERKAGAICLFQEKSQDRSQTFL